jgi:cyclopropane fatty-acyl-phospholipid synthase-like methyltransferase
MTDWYLYWNEAPIVYDDDFARQVGKTVNGHPMSSAQVDAMVDDVVERLAIDRRDRVLDLCCGNGLITRRCAARCREIIGVDFSAPLIRTASAHFSAENIRYVEADVRRLPAWLFDEPPTKIYMYEGLQHLGTSDLEGILASLRCSAARSAPILLASVPDRDRLWNFYDTPARREEYHRRVAEGTEAIGQWWSRADLMALTERCGYSVEFTALNPALHGAHYRFDALCRVVSA